MRRLRPAAVIAALGLCSSVPAFAEPPAAKDWEVEITPYLWATDLDGSYETRSRDTEHFDVDFDDILNALDLGAMGRVSARWRRWALIVDSLWVKLEGDQDFGKNQIRIDGKLEQQMALVQALAGYRLFARPGGLFGKPEPEDPRVFEGHFVAGVNYTYLSTEVELDRAPLGPLAGRERHAEVSEDWVAPAVGLRFHNDFTPRLRLETLGAVGGFGVGEAPEVSWQLTTLLSYRFTDHWLVSLGHRVIVADDDAYDVSLHGPILGIGYRF